MTELEKLMSIQLRGYGLGYVHEYRFAAEHVGLQPDVRKRLAEAGLKDWRADFWIIRSRLLIECEGGGWTGGRHTRGKGFADDLRKYAAAQRLGYSVTRFDLAQIKSGEAIDTVLEVLKWQRGKYE